MLLCRISTSVVYQLPKLRRRVRLPYPACNDSQDSYEFCDFSLRETTELLRKFKVGLTALLLFYVRMNGGLFHGN